MRRMHRFGFRDRHDWRHCSRCGVIRRELFTVNRRHLPPAIRGVFLYRSPDLAAWTTERPPCAS